MSSELDMESVGRIIVIRNKDRFYNHHAILDGMGGCIHVNKKLGKITIDPIDRVIKNARKVYTLEDDLDTRLNTYKNAMASVGSSHQYRFLTDNCETWVSKMKSGEAYSTQIDQISTSAAIGLLLLGSILL